MAEELQKEAAQEQPPQVVAVVEEEEVLVVTDVPQAENSTPTPAAVREPDDEEEPMEPKQVEEAVETDQVLKPSIGDDDAKSTSFKEESTKVADLIDSEKKALEELKQLVQEALNKHEFSTAITLPPTKEEENKAAEVVAEEVIKQPAQEQGPPAPEEQAKVTTETEVVAETGKDGAVLKEEKIDQMVETDGKMPAADFVDDDGAKTVEAIEETIVAVSSSSSVDPPQETNNLPSVKEPADQDQDQDQDQKAASAVLLEVVEDDQPEEVSIWGIPLMADERSNVILLKFLRARDFKVKDAFTMLKNTIRWRKEFGIDEWVEKDLGDNSDELEKVVFMHGFDKERHPVCYNVFGEFQNKELYRKTFSDEEKRERFLRWRIQFLERSIRKLDFWPGGISTIVQVNDLKNSPGPAKRELRQATKQALQLLQDNYPEFVAKQIFINVPWWYLTVNRMISPFLTQRTRSKFVFAGPSKSAEALFRYIAAEQIPVKYGGLMSKDGEFDAADAVTEVTLKPGAKHTVEFPVTEKCLLTWEIRVVGWDVKYGAEFVPAAEESYTVIIQKARKVGASDEPVVCNSFKTGEPGKVVLTIDNTTSKKKKLLLYRLKTKPSSD